jgi:HAD superfamily hydrolase (TIGR01490 family)
LVRSIESVNAAFFDLDKTVIAKASIVAFGRPLRREGLITRRTIVRAVTQQLIFLQFGADEQRVAKVRDSMLALTKGWDREQVASIVRETLIDTIEPLIYAEALEVMESHRQAGDRIYIVSAAPEEIVTPLAELLGVDGSLASRANLDEHNRYTGTMEFYCYGPNKAIAINELAERTGIDLARSSAYSDSATDIPMLEIVGHPYAVNPDKQLALEAGERGWEILEFTKPVRLRDRMTIRAPIVTGVIALGGVLLLGLLRNARRQNKSARPRSRASL